MIRQADKNQFSCRAEAADYILSRKAQVDVLTLNWQTREILLGERKWGTNRVDRQVVRELVEQKTPLVLKDLPEEGTGWKVHHSLFGRKGFTPAAKEAMDQVSSFLVDLKSINSLLGKDKR